MTQSEILVPAEILAKTNQAHFPNESAEYRTARNALLVKEIELRRNLEAVARMRRELPPGGELTKAYRFESETGPVTLADLFGNKDTLIVYNFMFGPARKNLCPSCTSFMNTWDKKMADIEQRAAFVMMARSPIERILVAKASRGWDHLKMVSDTSGDYTRDYVSAEDDDMPGYAVFTRRDGTIRHFWSGEMSGEMADPGQDPRGAPDPDPLWILLDTTPEGRGTDWYPKLSY
ncbi:MAG TPA: DUF899 family protein [Rhizomicrobium sp.]